MKIALTGHRPQRLKNQEALVRSWINDYLSNGNFTEAYSGMAMGADQIFAEECEKLNIPLVCCFPFKRTRFHPAEQSIMDKAKDIRFISDDYSKQSYWIRDKYMVDNCDVLLAVWDGIKAGGTWITLNYAEKIGKKVVYYDFNANKR